MSKDNDPFLSDYSKPEADTKSIGLCVPLPLTSAELESKYGSMRHGDLELGWPLMFEDNGHIEPLTPNDLESLKRLGVTIEEYLAVEISQAE
jgi:hypothetical protein